MDPIWTGHGLDMDLPKLNGSFLPLYDLNMERSFRQAAVIRVLKVYRLMYLDLI